MGHEFHELTRIKFSTASDGFTAARGCADWGFTDEREAALPIVREILRALLSEFNRRTRPSRWKVPLKVEVRVLHARGTFGVRQLAAALVWSGAWRGKLLCQGAIKL